MEALPAAMELRLPLSRYIEQSAIVLRLHGAISERVLDDSHLFFCFSFARVVAVL